MLKYNLVSTNTLETENDRFRQLFADIFFIKLKRIYEFSRKSTKIGFDFEYQLEASSKLDFNETFHDTFVDKSWLIKFPEF